MDKLKQQWTRGTWILVSFGAVMILLMLPATIWYVEVAWTARQIEQQLSAIRAAGEPVTWEELGPFDHEGAGHLYAAAFHLLALEAERQRAIEQPSSDGDEQWMEESTQETAEKMMESTEWLAEKAASIGTEYLLAAYQESQRKNRQPSNAAIVLFDQMLEQHQRALTLLHEAATIDACRFVITADLSSSRATPSPAHASEGTYLLLLQALRREETGDVGGALDSIIAASRLARVSRDQPAALVHEIGRSIEVMAAEAAVDLLSRVSLSNQQLMHLQAVLTEPDDERMFRQSVLAERVAVYHQLEARRYQPHDPMTHLMVHEPDRRKLVRDVLIDAAKIVEVTQQPWPRPLDARKVQYTSEESAVRGLRWLPMSREAHWSSKIRAAVAAIAIERYRREHDGAKPASLNVLVPKFLPHVPVDPMTGAPLRLITLADTYVIYGVGNNQRDDGGKIEPSLPERVSVALDWGVEVKTGGR